MSAPSSRSIWRPSHAGRTAAIALVTGSLVAAPLSMLVAPPALAAELTPPLSVKVDMTTATGQLAPGYTKDSGAGYTDAAGFGWVTQASLDAATHTPVDFSGSSGNTRDRGCTTLPAPLRTIIHMQTPTGVAGNTTPGAWEYKVPNGQYQVSVGFGDPNSGATAESHVLNVEGVRAVDGYPGPAPATAVTCDAGRVRTATAWATVTDGRLTVDAIGGTNTKLSSVTIDSVPVAGLTATVAAGEVALDWDDLSSATGFRVWRGDNLPVSTAGAPLATPTGSSYTDTSAAKGSVYYYAVAPAGTGAPTSVAVTGPAVVDDETPNRPALPFTADFANDTAAVPTGATRDFGQNYANTRGFGWVVPGTQKPLSLVGNGRARGTAPNGVDPKSMTLMHAQLNNAFAPSAGIPRAGAWQLAVADGRYDVEVSVGDSDASAAVHRVSVEGKPAIDGFNAGTSTGAARFKTATLTDVEVSDGFLTVDPTGGNNTKIGYVTVKQTPVDKPPAKPTAVTATAGDGSVALSWTAPADDDVKGYRVYRSTGATVATTGTPLNADLVTGTSYTDATAVNDTGYRYAVVAVDKVDQAGAASDVTAEVTPGATNPTQATLPLKINFVAAESAVEPGFSKDFGQAYTNARGRGWVTPGTHTGLDLVGNGRLRDPRTGVDLRQRGLLHVQGDDVVPAINGVAKEGAYEVAVPDGRYQVKVSVGDQRGATSYDSLHSINVEGTAAITKFQATAADEFESAAVVVDVTDGKLTIDAAGGTNTKINYLDIDSSTAPAAPTALTATAGDGSVALAWTAPAGPVAGYRVYRSTGTTVDTTGAALSGADLVSGTSYTDTTAANDTTYRYAVVAVSAAGDASSATAPSGAVTPAAATPAPATLPLKINFVAGATTPVAAGFSRDFGQAYTNARGRGWVTPGTHTGLDLVGNGRLRTRAGVDVRQNGLLHVQGDDVAPPFNGTAKEGAYEVALPDGTYAVTVSVGDQPGAASATCVDPCYDSLHSVNVEGTAAVTKFQATAGTEFATKTVTVKVVDGKLTVDAAGGTNTKINYLDIVAADVTAPGAPADVVATAGDGTVSLSWKAGTETDLAGYHVYAAAGDTVDPVEANRLTSEPQRGTTFVHAKLANATKVSYVVTAVDTVGNESVPSALTSATPKDAAAPAAPTQLSTVAGDGKVTVKWTASVAEDTTEYRIYRSTSSAVATTAANRVKVVPGNETGFLDTGLPNGTPVFYVVTAADAAGNESAASEESSTTPTPDPDLTAPAAPQGVKAVAGDNRATLSWTANTEPDLAGYDVYRSATPGVLGTRLNPEPLTGSSYVDTTVTNGSTYLYVVKAVDLVGNVSAGSTEISVKPEDKVAPAVPSGVSATAGIHSVTVRWNANTEADLRGYRIYRSTAAKVAPTDDNLVAIVLKNGGRAFLDTDRDAGVAYYYVVTADDRLGNESAASAEVSAKALDTPDTTAPAAPTTLVAKAGDADVTLTWTASTATDVAGYTVYRSSTEGGTAVKVTAALLTGTTYTDTGLTPGTTAYYMVTAVDKASNESTPSNQASATVARPTVDAGFVFQPSTATVPAGYTKDTGAPYSTTTKRGWVRQDSLAAATATPLDLTNNTRVRTRPAPVTDLQNRLIHMTYNDVTPQTAPNVGVAGAWEYGVPNGRYTVSASVGDQPGAANASCPAPCYDSVHSIRAEGVSLIDRFQATAAAEYKIGTATVDVTDGKLTLDAVGGKNTKPNWVRVVSAGAPVTDATAPAAPQALAGNGLDRSVTLTWTAPADTDVVGYRVYRADGAQTTVAVDAANLRTATALTSESFTESGLTNGSAYSYVVTALDASGNESVASNVRTLTPTPTPAAGLTLKVDFADAASTPAAGYLADSGQPYGARTGANQGSGNTYGWVNLATDAPLDLSSNGRNRGTADGKQATFLHMQFAANTNGNPTPGKWEAALPNGAYTVTVGVGDAQGNVDSNHWINLENQNALASFVPTTTNRFASATRTVQVADGKLTVSPAGGANTKITYVDIVGTDLGDRPYTTKVQPGNGATNTAVNAAPTTDNALNADVGAVDETTLGGGTVKLTRVFDGRAVAGTGATSGGGDTVSFKADAVLEPSTLYRFEITDGVKDKGGRAFMPFSSVFTTSNGIGTGDIDVAFDRLDSGAPAGSMYTSLVMGPDGKLYAGSILGQIYRFTVNPDGTLGNRETINTVRTHASAAGWEGAPNRTIIGLAFDPAATAANPILWITDNYAYLGQDVPNLTGAVARLSGPNLETYTEVVVNLPRSIKDHETNSLAFHDGKMYIVQGSMNAMGSSDGAWRRPENLLSAAMLELDPAKLPAKLPVDVATPDTQAPARGGVPAHQGTYDPYAPGAPLTLYATGIRNAYDLTWHSNGRLYAGTNGSAAGGNVPATPATLPASCAKRPDGGYPADQKSPAISGNRQAETDYVFAVKKGKYYGHPNPERCEWVLNAGNPAGYTGNPLFKVDAYPVGTKADPNYDLAGVYDAGLHASANGSIEYQNTAAFGGALKGKLIVVRYSANQEVVAFNVNADGSLSKAVAGITGFTGFRQPLDIAEDVSTGNLYVTELTDNPATTGIKLLKPQGGASVGRGEVTPRVVFTEVKGGAASAAKDVVVKNTGGAPLTVTAAAFTGTGAAAYARSGGPTLPVTIGAGASATFPVSFNPTAAGPQGAVLELTTDSPATAKLSTALRGLGTNGEGGSLEPSLQWILDTLQIPVNVGDPNPADNAMPGGSALLGDEVAVEAFVKAEGDHHVKVEALSLFGPDGPGGDTGKVVSIDAYTAGRPTDRIPMLVGPNTSNQQVLPAMTTVGEYDLDPAFGVGFTWHGLGDRVAATEDALNTWGGTDKHKVRVYPLKNADGSLEPFAYVLAPEDIPGPVDYQDAVVIMRNVKPAVLAGKGEIGTPTPELVYSGVRGTTSPAQDIVVTNTGTTSLKITGATLTGADAGAFTLVGGPIEIPVGGKVSYPVRFAPTTANPLGALSATVRFSSDDADEPTFDVGVYGLSTPGEQGGNEPPLKAVVDTLGYPINVGGTGLILGIDPKPIGDEVSAPLFKKVGAGPVTIKPVARYSPDELLPFGWYTAPTGTPELKPVGTVALGFEQTLNPGVTPDSQDRFDPGTDSFGFYVDSKSFGRKTYTQDGLNTNIPHGVRTYPVKDRSGKSVPGSYLVTFEDAQNGDYQDYVFLVTNVQPAGGATGTPVAKVDFTTSQTSVADGYTADLGAGFDTTRGFGWVKPGTDTPLDQTALTRLREGTQDLKVRSLVLMQPTAAQSAAGPGAWEYALPNGRYAVTVGAGDVSFTDSVHKLNVEGVTALSFTPTTAAPTRTGTVTVDVTDGKLTLDAVGGTNTKLGYVDISDAKVVADTTAPTVGAEVTGLQASAAVFKNEATVTVTGTDAQSGVAALAYSLDGAAFVAYTTPVKVTTAGQHTVRARAVDGAGNVSTSATTTFSVVTAGSSKAQVVLANGDGVPFTDRLVMNRIQNPNRGTTCANPTSCDVNTGPFIPANVVHDTATLVVRNTGTEALNVTGLPITGPFQLASPVSLPALVPVNGELRVPVRFTATTNGSGNGLWTGSLSVQSDDADEPVLTVQLAGFWQNVSEGGQEPDLREMFGLFGYTTALTAAGVPLNTQGQVKASGDEILSPYWLRADASQPVTVRQLAAFHTQGATATFRWHTKGSNTAPNVLTHNGVEGQSILPHAAGSLTNPAQGSFNPTGAFGLQIDGEWSDPSKNNQAVDVQNGCTAPCGQHVRSWAVRDRSGAILRNTWLVAMDYAGINYDYNDNLYLVTNMRPETATDPGAPAPLPGAASLKLGFDTAVAGTLVDRDGQGTGFRSTQPNVNDVLAGSNSYDRERLDVDTTGAGTLAITSSGTLTNGTNGSNDNTLVNGVRLPFDASSGEWTAGAKVLGPLSAINAGVEQAGVQFGPDQDNFAKMAVINRGGSPGVEFYGELNGVGQNAMNATAVLPAGATSVELFLIGDPVAGTLRGAYRVDGAAVTLLPTTWTLPASAAGRFFSTQGQAGLLVSNKGGEEFVARFDSFAVNEGNVVAPVAQRQALYRLDVAGTGNYTDTRGDVWTPDNGRFSPATAVNEGGGTSTDIAGTEDDVIYRTYRGNVGDVPMADRVLQYSLPSRGVTSVDLRLHFAERFGGNNAVGKRVFDISAEGRTVRSGFDIFAAAGGVDTATVLPVSNVAVVGGTIDLAFAAKADYPSIAGIEVLCKGTCPPPDTTAPAAPTGLSATASGAGVSLDWGDNTDGDLASYDVLRSTSATGTFTKVNTAPVTASGYVDTAVSLGTSYFYRVVALDSSENPSAASETATATTPTPQPIRINAGGPAQTVGATTWAGCTAVTACSGWVSGGNAYGENDTTTALPAGTNNAIFATEWTGQGNPAFRFGVPVLNGSYQVRLHFAELNKTAAGQRVFDVRLENTAVLTGFDVFAQAAGANKAIVRQFPVTITDGTVNLDFVSRVEFAKVSAIEIIPVDTKAPDQVSGVTATASNTGTALAWTARTESDLAGYNVYRAGTATGSFTKLNTGLLTGTTYADPNAPQGVASYYQVTAVDASGNESVRSSTVDATRPDSTPPGAVTGLTAKGTAAGIDLTWTARTESDLAGYLVYRSTAAVGPFTPVTTTPQPGTTFSDPSAVVGQPTYYQVSAVDRSGNESTKAAADGTRLDAVAPAQVGGVGATASGTGITVSWTAGTESDLVGYSVYRASSASGTYAKITGTLVTGTTFADASAPAGATSYYQVTASDRSGNESVRSATVSAARAAATQQPVRINTGGPAQTVGGTTWSGCAAVTSCSGWVSGGFPYGENDTITAIPAGMNNTMFQTEWTGGASGPGVVAVGQRAFGFAVPVANGDYRVRLHFAELNKTGAGQRTFDVKLENTAVLTKFDVWSAAGGLDKAVVRQFPVTVNDGVMTIDFVRQVENAKVSAIEILPADTVAPSTVTGVTASAAPNGVTVGWAASSATDLDGYRVLRSSSATGTFTPVSGSPVKATSFLDTTAASGVASYYRVTAVDDSGNESVVSTTVSATRPRPTIRINAGGPAQTVGGTTWSACTSTAACSGWVTGGFAHGEADTITGLPAGTNNAIYQTEWTGGRSSGLPVGSRAFGYNVAVPNGSYKVRLHFTELNKTAPGQRTFDVRLENTTVLSNYDIFVAAGGIDKAVVREFDTAVTDGAVSLDWITRIENAKVSAIEIIPS